MKNTHDITELLFPLEESEEDGREWELWKKATDEAYEIVGSQSPMELLRKAEELYNKYSGEKIN